MVAAHPAATALPVCHVPPIGNSKRSDTSLFIPMGHDVIDGGPTGGRFFQPSDNIPLNKKNWRTRDCLPDAPWVFDTGTGSNPKPG